MYRLHVTLSVKNFDTFEEFERKAAAIMSHYDGRIVSAYETLRNRDGSGEEVHIIQFPSEAKFNEYRADQKLLDLAEFREKAIASTMVKAIVKEKNYGLVN